MRPVEYRGTSRLIPRTRSRGEQLRDERTVQLRAGRSNREPCFPWGEAHGWVRRVTADCLTPPELFSGVLLHGGLSESCRRRLEPPRRNQRTMSANLLGERTAFRKGQSSASPFRSGRPKINPSPAKCSSRVLCARASSKNKAVTSAGNTELAPPQPTSSPRSSNEKEGRPKCSRTNRSVCRWRRRSSTSRDTCFR